MAATETATVDRCFARQDGSFGAICHLANGLAATVSVPEAYDEGTRLVIKRAGPQFEFVGRYASEPQRLP